GRMSTTTTLVDGKNGSLPSSSSTKVGRKSVTEDLVTTFSSPAAWLLVVALIVTWSAVAVVMFDLVDYKDLAGRSVNKLSTEPLRIIHQTLEESTDWLYGFFSVLSDIVWSEDEDTDEEYKIILIHNISRLKIYCVFFFLFLFLVVHREKPEKQDKMERKEALKVTPREKLERQEKAEKKERHAEKAEKPDRQEKKASPKEEKKVKSTRVEARAKKEVKDGKGEAKIPEKAKQAEARTTEVGLVKAKPKGKEEKALQTLTRSERKDQYAFCRYVIDMFAQGDFYPG
ncbi:TRDN protein, partial [Bucco capensis]|nr:TRDN protein [Bucco capensis]